MEVYISFLRGINVSGRKLIKMSLLKEIYSDLGFSDIDTYLQSGNVVFNSTHNSCLHLADLISEAILKKTGFDVSVIVLTFQELEVILQNNPYHIQQSADKVTNYFTLLKEIPSPELVQKLEGFSSPQETMKIDNKIIYLNLIQGYGSSKLNNNFIESRLKMAATTRNLKTMEVLLEMAGKKQNKVLNQYPEPCI